MEHWVQKDGESKQVEHPTLQGRHCKSWEADKIVDIVELGHVEIHCEYDELALYRL